MDEVSRSKMVNASDSKVDAQVSYGVGPLSAGSISTFQKEVETISGQGVKSGGLGADSGRDNVETADSRQGKLHCAMTVEVGHYISVGFGNISFGSTLATIGIGN